MAIDTLSLENCNNLGLDCKTEEFQNSGWSLEQEKEYVLDLIASTKPSPYHDFIYNWNIQLDFDISPEEVETHNHKTISNAWLLTPTTMPSVYYNNQFYVGRTSTLFNVYNYTLSLPENYQAAGKDRICDETPPVNEYNDCKTIYTGNKDMTEISVYKNKNLTGNDRLVSYVSEPVNNFETILDIKNEIYAQHYKWENTGDCCEYRYCCWAAGESQKCGRESRCGCDIEEKECRFDSEGVRLDTLQLKAKFTSKKEKTIYESESDVMLNQLPSSVEATAKINTKNLRSYTINTLTNTIKHVFSNYRLSYMYPPQNILHVKAQDADKWYASNSEIINAKREGDYEITTFTSNLYSLDQCSITTESFFNSSTQECNLVFLEERFIKLKTDKWFYKTNDTIEIIIDLGDNWYATDTVKLIYGSQVKVLQAQSSIIETTLTPELDESLIIAELPQSLDGGSSTVSAHITVYGDKNYTSYVVIIAVIFFIYFTIKKLAKNAK